MGFFSSRKAEPTPLSASEASSADVIRLRFHGNGKNKNSFAHPPSTPPPPPSLPLRREAVTSSQSQAVSGRQVSRNALTMSLAQRLNDLAVANADGLLDDDEYRLLRQNLFERFATSSDLPTEAPVVPISTGTGTRDSYHHVARPPSVTSQRSLANTVSSLFRRATARSSVSASASARGSVFSLQQQMNPVVDTNSVYSRPSYSGPPRSGGHSISLSRRPSMESLMSTSQVGSTSGSVSKDLRGVLTRHDMLSSGSGHYATSISSRLTTRSTKPPSSFHLRRPAPSPHVSTRTHENDNDEEHPKSAAELRAEIDLVESEGRNLLDAFNGLELTVLTKSHSVVPMSTLPDRNGNLRRSGVDAELDSYVTIGSSSVLPLDRTTSMRKHTHGQVHPPVSQPVHLKRRPSIVNSIVGSFKSSASDLRPGFLSSGPPSSLHSSRSSPNLVSSIPSPVSGMPALPISVSIPGTASSKIRPSSILRQPRQSTYPVTSVSGGQVTASPAPIPHLPSSRRPSTIAAAEPALDAIEAELADIRRRKADLTLRYELRLDFLRAKLKSAEIRERLSKK